MPYHLDSGLLTLTQGSESAAIHLYGATLTSWKSSGEERLFLSDTAVLDGTKAIRGGIPLVFPVFGKYPPNHIYQYLPQHGFARISKWRLLEAHDEGEGSGKEVAATFELTPKDVDASLTGAWPNAFKLQYRVAIRNHQLETQLTVQNTGAEAWPFNALFHTYLRVPDISQVRIHGLNGLNYTDKVMGGASVHETSQTVAFLGETDRVYAHAPQTLSVDVSGGSQVRINSTGTEDVVVWNPWVAKAKEMGDFDDEGWKSMVCVELGTVAREVMLAGGGGVWEGRQVLQITQ